MKYFIPLLLLMSMLAFSCKDGSSSDQQNNSTEQFKDLDFSELNKRLKEIKTPLNPQQIMRIHYPQKAETGEGNEQLSITENKLDNGQTEVTLIHDNLLDDSLRGYKHVMTLKQSKASWVITSLKMNMRCWDGRGSTDWGIGKCS